ncbi:type II toxin-antitoxin system Phd/YefM family antitoxin [Phenylobacterium sp.]|jgi:prevent-host-death family protein|uniref:type II toxin-antitoxin system Phd/YefM family antitoxin n=1 Tax=Phenylobacterium sp. TaxID=1871053 RepID=UPI0037C8E440
MSTYSVAVAKNGLPSLIDRALEGEEVIISRHGKPVAEIRPIVPGAQPPSAVNYEWLRARREARPAVEITSVALLDELYEDQGR